MVAHARAADREAGTAGEEEVNGIFSTDEFRVCHGGATDGVWRGTGGGDEQGGDGGE